MPDYKILNKSIGLVQYPDGSYVVLDGATADLDELFKANAKLRYVPLNPKVEVLNAILNGHQFKWGTSDGKNLHINQMAYERLVQLHGLNEVEGGNDPAV